MPRHRDITSGTVAIDCRSWPAPDQERWKRAFDPVYNPGPSRWSRPAQYQNAGVYTRYLDCAARNSLAPEVSPAGVQTFVAESQSRNCSAITIAGYCWAIWKVVNILRPEQRESMEWLKLSCCRIQRQSARAPKRRKHRKVESAELVLIGERLIESARSAAGRGFLDAAPDDLIAHRPPWEVIQRFRDGLFIVVGAYAPERLRALTSIRISQIDLQVASIAFDGTQIKTGRATRRFLPLGVIAFVKEWLHVWRASQAPRHDNLWLAKGGKAAVPETLYRAMIKIMDETLGFRVSPHDFRDAAATTVVENLPEAPRLASIMLDHRTEEMTANYTEQANQIKATRSYAEIVDLQRGRTARQAREVTRSAVALHPRARKRRRGADAGC